MNRRTKTKAITTIILLIISVFALYTFIFVADISMGWRITLIVISVFWIISGISNLIEYFGKK